MNGDRLLREIAEIEAAWADQHDPAVKRRRIYGDRSGLLRTPDAYPPLRKAGDDGTDDAEPSAHAKTKADHHEKMAEYHARIADAHTAMKDHYSSGAGAHTFNGGDDEHDVEERGPLQDDDQPTDAEVAVLKASAAAGDVAARLALVEIGRAAVSQSLRTGRHVGDPSGAAFNRVLRRSR